MNVYSLTWPQDGGGGVARKPGGWWPPKLGRDELLPTWEVPTFTLEGKVVDLQPNDAGIKLFSPAMQELFEANRAAIDRIEWLPVRIQARDASRLYAIPHLLDELDIIDARRSVVNRATGGIIRAHLRAEGINGHRVFTYSNATGLIVLFTEQVYEAVKNCTGCSFLIVKASVSDAPN